MPTVMAENTKRGPAIFRDAKNDITIEWAGTADGSGGHIQPVPESLLEHPQFLKAVRSGVIIIRDDDPEVRQLLDQAQQRREEQQEASRKVIEDAIQPETNNDFVGQQCVGPSPKGGQCDQPVPVRQDNRDAPPLCPKHSGLIGQYVLQESDEVDAETGEAKKKWVRVTVSREALPSEQ